MDMIELNWNAQDLRLGYLLLAGEYMTRDMYGRHGIYIIEIVVSQHHHSPFTQWTIFCRLQRITGLLLKPVIKACLHLIITGCDRK